MYCTRKSFTKKPFLTLVKRGRTREVFQARCRENRRQGRGLYVLRFRAPDIPGRACPNEGMHPAVSAKDAWLHSARRWHFALWPISPGSWRAAGLPNEKVRGQPGRISVGGLCGYRR